MWRSTSTLFYLYGSFSRLVPWSPLFFLGVLCRHENRSLCTSAMALQRRKQNVRNTSVVSNRIRQITKVINRPFSKRRLRLWIRLQAIAWPRGCFDNCTCCAVTRSGLQTRRRSLKPNPNPKPWFRKGPNTPHSRVIWYDISPKLLPEYIFIYLKMCFVLFSCWISTVCVVDVMIVLMNKSTLWVNFL